MRIPIAAAPARKGLFKSLDPGGFRLLSFDCYGTLVDWESGILASLRPLARSHGIEATDAQILEAYARLEAEAEKPPYRPYREVLETVAASVAREWGFEPTVAERRVLVNGFGEWEPFPDTVEALRMLHGRYRLAIISNVDDDLFDRTRRRLGVAFDWVTTASQARAYKPDRAVFELALARMKAPRDRILHVAQSLYHDVVPASALGLSTVWVRRASRAGRFGVSPPSEAAADEEVPDLRSLVRSLGLE